MKVYSFFVVDQRPTLLTLWAFLFWQIFEITGGAVSMQTSWASICEISAMLSLFSSCLSKVPYN